MLTTQQLSDKIHKNKECMNTLKLRNEALIAGLCTNCDQGMLIFIESYGFADQFDVFKCDSCDHKYEFLDGTPL